MKEALIISCLDMSPPEALQHLIELGFEDIDKVPTGPGRDYLTTLVLIAKNYDFGGVTFDEARLELHYTNWRKEDAETEEKKRILETGRFERFS
jgi:hypothetical protein